MGIPLLHNSTNRSIRPEFLSPEAFAPFGAVITSPLHPSLNSVNTTPPQPLHPANQPQPTIANQGTAYKYAPISPLTDNYPSPSRPQMSMFSCFPRTSLQNEQFPLQILERHPYTTQTFCPLGLSDPETCFLVIVAPTSSTPATTTVTAPNGTETTLANPPDLERVKAFVANGRQAVTYGPGTWHAPMVVLGRRRVDFVVTQFVSGVAEEDCQEVGIVGGITVDVAGLGGSSRELGRVVKL